MKSLLLICLVLYQAVAVLASGVGVHAQLVARIRQHLSSEDQALSTYTIPGAFFPDAFYDCMGLSDTGEATHWPPFLLAAAEYYHETYVLSNKQKDGAGLRAFLIGALTHQVADVPWHSLGVDQGLLMALSHREFGGDTQSAHRILDTGGDMIMMFRILRAAGDLDWLTQRWTIPSADLLNIYKRLQLSVSRPALEYCMARGVAALGAEVNLARTMYPSYAKKSPLLLDVLEDYFMGGLHSITASILPCLRSYESWLDNGPPKGVDAWDICEVFAGRAPFVRSGDAEQVSSTVVGDLQEYIDEIIPALALHPSADGSETFIEFPNVILPEHMLEKRDQTVLKSSDLPRLSQPIGVTLSTGLSESLFGSVFTVGDFRGSDIGPCLAVSAPYEYSEETQTNDGAVYVIPLAEIDSMFSASNSVDDQSVNLKDYRISPPSLPAFHPSRREIYNLTFPRQFGASMTPIKLFNTTLLAVSSPGISSIDIFAGPELLMTIMPPTQGSTTTYGGRGRKLFGSRLLVHDVDGDGLPEIIVCAPLSDLSRRVREQGEIMILSGRELQTALASGLTMVAMDHVRLSRFVTPKEISIPDDDLASKLSLDTSASTFADYQLFGSQIAFSEQPDSIAYVGAPGSGAVFAFDAKTGVPLFGMFAELGSVAGYGGGVLLTGKIKGLGEWILVGSPNEAVLDSKNARRRGKHAPGEFGQGGVCYLYVRREGSDKTKPKLAAYVISDSLNEKFVKFGYAGTPKDGDPNTVYISSPFAGAGEGAVWLLPIEDVVLELISREGTKSSRPEPVGDFEIFDNIASMSSEQPGDVSPSLLSTPIIRLKPMLWGTRTNNQIESWFGKSVASYADFLFVSMPHLGFGQLGDRTSAGKGLNAGGVSVYKL
ncbi:hypothetical protein BZA70DRAFT_274227 [Myxozyma melibiosi]|uniref:Phospholipase C/D domain-containing protein n=1 Tax=Myxozyma melibiosi TaxID=54550 RepID=A0ABR1FFL5_9ASCO